MRLNARAIFVLALLVIGIASCSEMERQGELHSESASVKLQIMNPDEGVDWETLNIDFDGSHFEPCVMTVDGESVRTLGLRPRLEYIHRSTEDEDDVYTLAEFDVAARKGGLFFILRQRNGLRILLLIDIAGIESVPLSPKSVFEKYANLFVPVQPNTTYVEPELFEVAGIKRVKLPDGYEELKPLFISSRNADRYRKPSRE